MSYLPVPRGAQPPESPPPQRSGAWFDPVRAGARPAKPPGLLLEYLQTAVRGWWVILLFAALGIASAALFNAVTRPMYRARTSLNVQALNQNLLNLRSNDSSPDQGVDTLDSYIQTQIKILQSDAVVNLAVKRLKAEPESPPAKKTGGFLAPRPLRRDALLDDAVNALKVRPLGAARLIEATCESSDAILAADFCNALANAYIQDNLLTRSETAMSTSEWLTTQLEDVKTKLSESEGELQAEAQKSALLYSQDRESVGQEKLRELQSELSRAQADRMIKQAQYQTAKTAKPESRPSIVQTPGVKELQLRLVDLRRQLADLSSFTPEYWKVKKIRAQIDELESALATERSSTVEGLRSDLDEAGEREKLLSEAYATQRAEVAAQLGDAARYELLKSTVNSQRQLYEALMQRVKEAGFAVAMRSSTIHVVDAAAVPKIPFAPRRMRNLATGVLAGGILGFGLVLFRHRSDSRIRLPGEAMNALNVWELGVIPSAPADRKGKHELLPAISFRRVKKGSAGPVSLVPSSSLLADSYRATMSSLLLRAGDDGREKTFVLASPSANEGKTTVISNLGIAFAEAKRRVLLIDGDMQRPSLHKIFDLGNSRGLRDALRGDIDGDNCPIGLLAQPTVVPRLFVLPSGSGREQAAGLLHLPALKTLIARMRQEFDVVLIDTPPMLHMADARLFARLADGVILVLRSAMTTGEEAIRAQYMFQQDFTTIVGVVLNDFNPKREGRFGYYKSYHEYRKQAS